MVPDQQTQELLQTWYATCRKVAASGKFSMNSARIGFDSIAFSALGRDVWRPTHITEDAVRVYLGAGRRNTVQRAHGALEGRLDRKERTERILLGPEMEFAEWWDFIREHDKTVLVTKNEHFRQRRVFKESDLIPLPPWSEGMFDNAGKNVRIRVRKEIAWLRKIAQERGIHP